jgi:hypothetical protein
VPTQRASANAPALSLQDALDSRARQSVISQGIGQSCAIIFGQGRQQFADGAGGSAPWRNAVRERRR